MTEGASTDRSQPVTRAKSPTDVDPRVRMASERTFLAWIRTGLAMMGFGFVVARFGLFLRAFAVSREELEVYSTGVSLWVGTTLVLMGVAVNLLTGWQHARLMQRFKRGEDYQAPQWSLGIVVAIILAVLGILMALNLTFLN
jgi:putative membrane protein